MKNVTLTPYWSKSGMVEFHLSKWALSSKDNAIRLSLAGFEQSPSTK
jgi:hypothetical protein